MQTFWLKPGLRHAGDMRNLLVFARFARLKVSDARLQPRLPQALPRFAATQCAGLNTRSTRIIDTSYFYFGLVLGCIDADLCNKIVYRISYYGKRRAEKKEILIPSPERYF